MEKWNYRDLLERGNWGCRVRRVTLLLLYVFTFARENGGNLVSFMATIPEMRERGSRVRIRSVRLNLPQFGSILFSLVW